MFVSIAENMEEKPTDIIAKPIQDASHLFDESLFGDIFTELDVKERLQTRERNAREDRALQFVNHILERAHRVRDRRCEHEQRMIRNQLYDIQARTASLRDEPCIRSPRKSISRSQSMRQLSSARTTCSQRSRSKPRESDITEETLTRNLPPIKSSIVPADVLAPFGARTSAGTSLANSPDKSSMGKKSSSLGNLTSSRLYESDNSTPEEMTNVNLPKLRHGAPHGVSSQRTFLQHADMIKYSTRHNIEKAAHISQSLDDIYRNRQRASRAPDERRKPTRSNNNSRHSPARPRTNLLRSHTFNHKASNLSSREPQRVSALPVVQW